MRIHDVVAARALRLCRCRAASPAAAHVGGSSTSHAAHLHALVASVSVNRCGGAHALLADPHALPLVQQLASPSGDASSIITSYAGSPQAVAVLAELLCPHLPCDTAAALAAAAAAPPVLTPREELCAVLQDPSVRAALKHARRSGSTAAVLQTKGQRALQLLQRELEGDPATQQLVGCIAAAAAGEQQQERWQQRPSLVVQQQQQHTARQEAPLKQQQQHRAAAMPAHKAPALARR